MEIAIQGHSTRGKEVIQILESLGGKKTELTGTFPIFYHLSDKNEIINNHKKFLSSYKLYTLEEFEKEFPFKIGDIVLLKGVNKPYKIIALEWYMNKLCYKLDNELHYTPKALTTYKEMKEERNITLTLDKAKEWYKKGGELKEIALQAYSEEELTKVDLPKTWEEFYEQFEFKHVLNNCLSAVSNSFSMRYVHKFEAFVKLQYLRDCWRQGWEPSRRDTGFSIKTADKGLAVYSYYSMEFLSFPTREMAEEFLECFRDLIKQAGDLV